MGRAFNHLHLIHEVARAYAPRTLRSAQLGCKISLYGERTFAVLDVQR
jgi:hypothetical protein